MAIRRIILDVEEKGLNHLKPHSKLHKSTLVHVAEAAEAAVVEHNDSHAMEAVVEKSPKLGFKSLDVVDDVSQVETHDELNNDTVDVDDAPSTSKKKKKTKVSDHLL